MRSGRHVVLRYPAGSLTPRKAAEVVARLDRGLGAAKRFVGKPDWQFRGDRRIYFYLPDEKFVAHAPGGNTAFVPLWRIRDDQAPWLHEALHLLLDTEQGDWLGRPGEEAQRRMPLWLYEGLAESLAMDISAQEGLVHYSPLIEVPASGLDALCAEKLRTAPSERVLASIGARGKLPELFGPDRVAYAIPFYTCATSFVRHLAARFGNAPLLHAIAAFDAEHEVLERETGVPLAQAKADWLRAIGVADPPGRAVAPDGASLQGEARTSSARLLEAVAAELDAFTVERSLGLRLLRGLPVERFPDLTLAAAEEEAAFGAALLEKLEAAREEELGSDDLDTLGILRFETRAKAERSRFYWLDVPITPYRSPLREANQALARFLFAKTEDGDRYARLLEKYAAWIGGIESLLREQARRGRVVPAPEISVAAAPFEALQGPGEALFTPSPERLTALPEAARARISGDIAVTVQGRVAPAVRSLLAYLKGDYAKEAPAGVGLSQYKGGEEAYRWLVRQNTTLDLKPEEIHRLGLAEMERIRAELEEVRVQVGFEGDLAAFLAWARTAPRFFAETPEEVGAKLMAAQERMTPKLPQLFGRMPKAPYGVARLDPSLEGAMTFGYYEAPSPGGSEKGLYYFNGSRLDQRSTLLSAPLIYHELAPGHHFQIALQRESSALPAFRRESGVTAFTEGWGEYASALAGEAGMYDDPYDRLGRLMEDAFLTARLVVDTGMNLLGWSREKAMEYMAKNTLQSPEEIASETLRYGCDIPAQALAYKLGARKIRELRDLAEKELGAAYDVRRFHDEVLAGGAMPLGVLERRIERFIAREKAARR